tara:strand:- start:508 stop:2052 length:1545 start_codon:yes stop_codon:yes gene_type:complete
MAAGPGIEKASMEDELEAVLMSKSSSQVIAKDLSRLIERIHFSSSKPEQDSGVADSLHIPSDNKRLTERDLRQSNNLYDKGAYRAPINIWKNLSESSEKRCWSADWKEGGLSPVGGYLKCKKQDEGKVVLSVYSSDRKTKLYVALGTDLYRTADNSRYFYGAFTDTLESCKQGERVFCGLSFKSRTHAREFVSMFETASGSAIAEEELPEEASASQKMKLRLPRHSQEPAWEVTPGNRGAIMLLVPPEFDTLSASDADQSLTESEYDPISESIAGKARHSAGEASNSDNGSGSGSVGDSEVQTLFPEERVILAKKKAYITAGMTEHQVRANLVADLVSSLVQTLDRDHEEEKEFQTRVEDALAAFRSSKATDFELLVPDLLEALGPKSNALRVLRAITQNIIFIAIYKLHTVLKGIPMTKDTDGFAGWHINIHVSSSVVTVSHFRRNSSLATCPEEERFAYDWALNLTFGRQPSQIQFISAGLRTCALFFGPKTSQQFKDKISRAFCGGRLILA